MVDVDAPSENRAALAARGCDEPGLAAVAGVVVTGAGAAVTGAAAVAGERCLVAMFAPRPLLTSSGQIRPLFGSNALRRRFAYAEPSEGLPALLARCGRA